MLKFKWDTEKQANKIKTKTDFSLVKAGMRKIPAIWLDAISDCFFQDFVSRDCS